jgi:TetR/AcrR family transcriptional regulator, transcriptional repressor of aconitase
MREMPKVTQEHLDARRTEILDGARRAFARHGYGGATVSRLEEEIGLSRGAIFHYFPSKLDLFFALAVDDNLRYQRMLAEQGIEAVLRALAAEDRNWLTVFIETEVRLWHDPEFERRMAGGNDVEPLLAALAGAQADGRLRGDVELSALLDFALIVVNGLAVRLAGGQPIDVEALIRLVGDALRPRDPARVVPS